MSTTTTQDPWPLPELQRARRAIVVVDVVESVRLMQEDESGFIDRWRRFVNQVRAEVLPAHGGRLVKSLGDGMLLEFAGVPQAVTAALALQQNIATGNATHDEAAAIQLRIGIHVADVVVDELDVYGAGVNLAARVAALAAPGSVAVTATVRDEIVDGLDAEIEDLGPCWLKHVESSVHAFALRSIHRAPDIFSRATDIALCVAVLPLLCTAGRAQDALLGDFIADSLISTLSLAPELKVLSRLSTRAVGERKLDARQSGLLLGAKYLVSGSFALDGGRAVIDVELCDSLNGGVIWAQRHACTVGALFEHPSAPLELLAMGAHQAMLASESRRVRSRPLPNLEAYTLLLGSIGLLHCTALDDFNRARVVLDALIDREPRHGAGYTWLAKWHLLRMIRGLATVPQREREEARRRADQAIERDADSGSAWSLRGLVQAFNEHDLVKAEASYAQALDCNPSESLAWLYMATLRSWQGRGPEAAVAAQRALALSPLDPMRYYFESLAAAAMLADARYAEAITLAQSSLRVHRGHTPTYRVMTIAQMLSGQPDDARRTMALMRESEPTLTVAQYLERYPGRDAPHARTYADALHAAGLPD
ncbi:MAG: adenylate/guanylate cyclase domain-containing protein [Pseudomonadota bacterium]